MAYETIVYENVEERIFRLTLNRPEKLNAMSPALLDELDGALGEFERDRQASVLIIRGAGRAFCAGYDLTAPPATDGGPFTITEDRWAMRKLVEKDAIGWCWSAGRARRRLGETCCNIACHADKHR